LSGQIVHTTLTRPDPLGTQIDRSTICQTRTQNSSADPITSLENDHPQPRAPQQSRRIQASETSAYY
ncbi:MAG: hypothetical protein WA982_12215, partial [Rubrobacteraceae bacterium]